MELYAQNAALRINVKLTDSNVENVIYHFDFITL